MPSPKGKRRLRNTSCPHPEGYKCCCFMYENNESTRDLVSEMRNNRTRFMTGQTYEAHPSFYEEV